MKNILNAWLLLLSAVATAQPQSPVTPPAVVTVIEGVTGKRFEPDTAYATLSADDQTLLTSEPVANWGLAQISGPTMTYYNLVVGTRSYQLLVTKDPRESRPRAMLLRFRSPGAKPEAIARGILHPSGETTR